MTETTLDARGLLCPLPVLKARKALNNLGSGGVLTVETTDPASAIDMPHFCSQAGHDLLAQERDGPVFRFRIRKKGG